MPKFYYVARDETGLKIKGEEEASSQEDIVLRLQEKKYVILSVSATAEDKGSVKEADVGVKKGRPRFQRSGMSSYDLVLFCRQLATLLGAGVTILKSLDITSKQVASRRLYEVIKDLEKNMEAGLSFHEAMAKHKKVFSELWINLIESGEASGSLNVVLTRLAAYLERSESFKKKVISSLMYPGILMFVSLAAMLFMSIVIIPIFAKLFESFNYPLPPLTKLLIMVSNAIRHYGILMLLGGIGIFFILKKYLKTKSGRLKLEVLQMNMPVFGQFFRSMVIERFSAEMNTLIESGVPILYCLEITEHSVDNLTLSSIIRRIKEDVRDGKPLSKPIEKSGFFEPMVVQLVDIGEEIGELPQMFKRINDFYQEYVETFIGRLASIFEPVLLIFMGLVVGVMVIGMFMPIFQIASAMK